jgi:hypothetical protein
MNEFKVGDAVTILGVNKPGEVTAVSEDGQVTVKYTDDAGAEATETGTADKFAPAVKAAASDEAKDEEGSDDEDEDSE